MSSSSPNKNWACRLRAGKVVKRSKKCPAVLNKTYLNSPENLHVIEIGSQNVNSSVKELIDKNFKYIGVDIAPGDNVDIVLKDPYKFPIDDNSIDVVISISTFEHVDFFWLTFLEILRVIVFPAILFFISLFDNLFEIKFIFSIKKSSLEIFSEKVCSLPKDFASLKGVTGLLFNPCEDLKK